MILQVLVLAFLMVAVSAGGAAGKDRWNSCEKLLMGSLGDQTHPISTKVPEAQRFYDKGMALAFGFNHAESKRAFAKAAELDPECAMCNWGIAFVLGPNINAPMDDAAVPEAYAAIQKALKLSVAATDKEKAKIQAMAKRYAPEPVRDRSALDKAYAEAMRDLRNKFPEDTEAVVFFAEALMDLNPWNYWDADGKPKNSITEVVAALESALKINPNHPHANHLYIHAVEASKDPDRAVPSADRLGDLQPGAGHLVHMPAHIYIRTGQYHKAAVANERAIVADDKYRETCTPKGIYPLAYMPHNHHFLWAAYTWEGRGDAAIKTARTLVERVDTAKMRLPGLGTLQHFWVTPMFALARFERWDDILKESVPPEDLKYPNGVWHHVRGMAYVAQDRLDEAKDELKKLEALAADPDLKNVKIWGKNKVSDLLNVGAHLLTGKIEEKQGNTDAAIKHYQAGIELEDSLYYEEPHTWYYPMRQPMGHAQLKSGQAGEAEKYFLEDLERHRGNGWSLYGLLLSARAMGDKDKIQNWEQRFQKAWAHADFAFK